LPGFSVACGGAGWPNITFEQMTKAGVESAVSNFHRALREYLQAE
jgi:hypothetical protein